MNTKISRTLTCMYVRTFIWANNGFGTKQICHPRICSFAIAYAAHPHKELIEVKFKTSTFIRYISPRGWRGTLTFHTYVGSGHLFGFKIFKLNFWGVFRKSLYFLEYEDFVDIFGGTSQNWTLLRGHF